MSEPMQTGFYPDFPRLCAWTWIGTLCFDEHRENCGCPGTPGFKHRDECHCYDEPVMREWYEQECPLCHGTGKTQDHRKGPVR